MRIGLAADHGGFALKQSLLDALADSGHELVISGPPSSTRRTTTPTS